MSRPGYKNGDRLKIMKQTRRKRPPLPAVYRRGMAALAAAVGLLLVLVLCLQGRTAPMAQEETEPTLEANPYGPEDFVYDGSYLTCTVSGSRLGVDVSEHQEGIDWQQVSQAGMEFAMIRLGYRGYSEGGLYRDAHALDNLRQARAEGLSVGAYFYSQAVTVEEAREEAELAVSMLEGMDLDMPLVYDWEYVSEEARTAGLDARTLTDCALAFCRRVEQAGYRPMVYFNLDLGGRLFLLEELSDYDFWLAMYQDRMDYPYRVQMWQYTAQGTVPGIPGEVDLDIYLP